MAGALESKPLSDLDYAVSDFQKAIKQNEQDQGAYMGLVFVYYENELDDKMLSTLETVYRKFPDKEEFLGTINKYAQAAAKEKRYSLAEKLSKMALNKFGEDQDNVQIYANILFAQGKLSQMQTFLKSYIAKNPTDILMTQKLIDVYLYRQDFEGAYQLAKSSHQKNYQEISFYFLEGLALQGVNQNQAKTYYKAYLDKLSYGYDFPNRVQAAKAILKVMTSETKNPLNYYNLIQYLKKIKAPTSHIVVQAYSAYRLFPSENKFFTLLKDEYEKVGLNYDNVIPSS